MMELVNDGTAQECEFHKAAAYLLLDKRFINLMKKAKIDKEAFDLFLKGNFYIGSTILALLDQISRMHDHCHGAVKDCDKDSGVVSF